MAYATCNITAGVKETKTRHKKWPFYGAPIFCAFWFALFYATVIPSFYSYPKPLTIENELLYPDEFIGERAQRQLAEYAIIGNKMTGSINNEVHTVNFLLREIQKIKDEARTDLYDIEVEMQYSSGSFFLWSMAMKYENVSNVVVKISTKNNQSKNYLLINAHYDSEVKSPAVADDGVMVVIMMETLRVISRSERTLTNPIVFLFNGAEEANMLASHGFITQHKWAPNCKALINLDSTGSGGREVLFQTGPNHPWLVKYYKENAPHPFSSTIAEELFQNNFIPSDTDFRVFRDYGSVPGLDMAHALNGYVYHTKYDNFQNLERRTTQHTGENVLAITWALANAPELENTASHAEGHAIFYDFLGWFMISYTENTSIIINSVVCLSAAISISISLFQMTSDPAADVPSAILLRFCIIFIVQIGAVAVAGCLTLLVALILQGLNLTQSWYYSTWMTFGLYFCTMFFGMSLIPAIYISWTKLQTNMKLNETISCFMHAHCLILVIMCIVMTSVGIRSAFFPMIGIFFYTISTVLHLLSKPFKIKSLFISIHLACQIMPFWFYTYIGYVFLVVFTPMQGRDGPDSKPELLISGFIVLITIHFAGFIIPILHKFHKTKLLCTTFGALTIIFIILAATPVGFPFKEAIAAQRYYVLHTQRTLHNADNTTTQESGFYIQPVDTRYSELFDTTLKNAEPESWISENCANEPFCGLPLYSGRWLSWKDSARWINASVPQFPIPTVLTLTSKESIETKLRFEFSIISSRNSVIYISPYNNVKMTNWSFDTTILDESHEPPYFLYSVYLVEDQPLTIWFELELEAGKEDGPYLKIGVGAHFLYHQDRYTEDFRSFLNSFPKWTYTTDWFASYESWIF